MNLPKPMTAYNYDKIANWLNVVEREVANETMRDALVDVLSKSKDPNDDTVIDTAVSCDGSRQKKGYSSLNGVILVMSMDNGKILEIEPMNRTCKSCLLHEKLKNSHPKRFVEPKLTHVCKINHVGTSRKMGSEGVNKEFGRDLSGKKKLRYTEFYGGMERVKVFWQ